MINDHPCNKEEIIGTLTTHISHIREGQTRQCSLLDKIFERQDTMMNQVTILVDHNGASIRGISANQAAINSLRSLKRTALQASAAALGGVAGGIIAVWTWVRFILPLNAP